LWVCFKKNLTDKSASGWTGFALSSTNSIQNTSMIFVMWSNGWADSDSFAYKLKSHQSNVIDPKTDIAIPISRELNPEYDIRQGIYYTLSIPSEFINENETKYIMFACTVANKPAMNASGFYHLSSLHTTVFVSLSDSGLEKCENIRGFVLDFSSLEENYEAAFFTSLAVSLTLFLLCMLFRNEQPLKSRGIIPFAILFNYYVLVLSFFSKFYLTRETRMTYFCIIQDNGRIPSIMILSTLLFFDYLRVVLILALNRNKTYIRHSDSSFLIKMIKFMKFMNSDFSVVAIIIFFHIFVQIIEGFIFLISSFQCNDISTFVEGFLGLYIFACIVGVIIILFVDVALSFKNLIKCKWREVLLKDDPFYFRIQQMIGLFAIFLMSIAGVILLFPALLASIFDKNLINWVYFGSLFVSSIFNYIFLFYVVVITLLITIFKKFYSKIFKSSQEMDVEDTDSLLSYCLTNKDVSELFKAFCDSEWSSENYLLYFDIQQYKELPTDQRKEFSLKLFNLYLNGASSDLEVNVTQKECEILKKNIDSDLLTDDLFSLIEKAIESNMKDTLKRFIFSKEYQSHHSHLEFLKTQTNNQD
jgi:hypothetical protein